MSSGRHRLPDAGVHYRLAMSSRDRLWLRVTVGWTLFVWLVFTRNIVGDPKHSFGFKAVHVALAIVSIVLAIGVWAVASRNRTEVRD
jgi:succinate-acetate transporter protein